MARSEAGGIALLLVLLVNSPGAQEGKLEQVRTEVRASDDDHDDDDDYEDDEYDHDEGNWLWCAFDGALEDSLSAVVLLPFRAPRLMLGDTGFARATFERYPGRGGPGFWRVGTEEEAGRELALRPWFALGTDFDDLERTAFGFELEHASRFGLELEWARWREDLAAGASDELDLGEFSVVYRFAQARSVAFHSGLGLNVLHDEQGSDYGLDWTYGATFLASPLTFGLDFDLGTLGDASLTHLGASAGLALERFELFVAHERWEIDSVDLDSTSLGLRGWF